MINIDTLTLGNELKDEAGNLWKVTSNVSYSENKFLIELEKVEPVEPPQELTGEKI